ncbi:MAG: AraC family transcriptional regulator [Oscillospiraceae bacterium]|nr:AraC family transcriptional regulator [Oscillospiraceae bacterium]
MNTWIENYFDDTLLGDLRLFYCGKREKSISHHYGPYKHEDYQLVYIAEGAADFRFGDQLRRIEASTFYVMYPQCGMSYRTDPQLPWTIYWVIAGGQQLEAFLGMLGLSPDAPFLTVSDSEKLLAICKALFEKSSRDGLSSRMECLSLLYGLFSVLAENRTADSRNVHIAKALDYISRHYSENISVQALSERLHLNYNYFSRLFKQEMGVSPIQFISAMRVKKAEYLLKYTSLSVSEIARAVGFQDVLYFSRAFKRCTGMSPSAYKSMAEI